MSIYDPPLPPEPKLCQLCDTPLVSESFTREWYCPNPNCPNDPPDTARPELIVLPYLKDLPKGVGFISTTSLHTEQEAREWAANECRADKVYCYHHAAGYMTAWVIIEKKAG